MPRPRHDGTPAAAPNKRKLTEIFLQKLKPHPGRTFIAWDTHQRGLAVQVQPTGYRSWKVYYPFHGRPRWYHLGAVDAISLSDARRLAARVLYRVAEGADPVAERAAERGRGTFAELATRYVETYAKRKNKKSWKQADALVRRFLIPKWGKLPVADIARVDVKALMGKIEAPVVANQTLAAASAIFSWAIREEVIKTNPCLLVERNKTKARERVLSDSEIPKFWKAFDDAGLLRSVALKLILLTGQRPGEVAHMRYEHIVDGYWWELPGEPVPELKWPGTKNAASHRVWLSKPVQDLLTELNDEPMREGFVFGRPLGKLDGAMRDICKQLNVAGATPHDLRRSFSTKVTGLGFGRDALNRITNHKEGGIASVYDRHGYADENKQIMERVATHIMDLVAGRSPDNVVRLVS